LIEKETKKEKAPIGAFPFENKNLIKKVRLAFP
jgi:hypothetical protein